MSNTPHHAAIDTVHTIWVCENDSCDAYGHGIEVELTQLPDIGTPLCTDCEEEMTLGEYVVIK